MKETDLIKIALEQVNQSIVEIEKNYTNDRDVNPKFFLETLHQGLYHTINATLGTEAIQALFKQYKCDNKEDYIKKAVEKSLSKIV